MPKSNLTHLLQLIDISVFRLLKQNQKKLFVEKTRFITYNINNVDFIDFILQGKEDGIKS